MGKLIVFGCGGHARSVLDILSYNQAVNDIVLVDENARENESIMGWPVVKSYCVKSDDLVFSERGNHEQRKNILECFDYCQWFTVISKQAYVAGSAEIKKGTMVAHRAHLGPEAQVGRGSIINTGSIVEHESVIGDYVHVAPGSVVCGRSRIGNYVMLGAGSTVIDRISICDNVIIGAGSVVVMDITDPGTYVGAPAHKIK